MRIDYDAAVVPPIFLLPGGIDVEISSPNLCTSITPNITECVDAMRKEQAPTELKEIMQHDVAILASNPKEEAYYYYNKIIVNQCLVQFKKQEYANATSITSMLYQ